MPPIFMPILASILFSVSNITDKYVLSKLNCKPVLMLLVSSSVGFLWGLAALLGSDFTYPSGLNLFWVLMAGMSFTGMVYFYFKAMELEDISKVVPLFYSSPLIVTLLAVFFLGEVLDTQKYVGIFLLVSAAIFLSTKKSLAFNNRLGLIFTLLSGFSLALNQIIVKYLLNFYDYWTVFGCIRITAFLTMLPVVIWTLKDLKILLKNQLKAVVIVTCNESMSFLAYLLLTFASAHVAISVVNALLATQPFFVLLFTVLLGFVFPKIIDEKLTRSTLAMKFIAIAVMFGGIMLIQ